MTVAAWATDVHFDFLSDTEIKEFLQSIEEDILIITGDLSTASRIEHHLDLIDETFKGRVIFVLGNHDFYHGAIDPVRELVESKSKDDLLYLHGKTIKIGSTYVVGVDAWADGILGKPSSDFDVNDHYRVQDLKFHPNQLLKRRELGRIDADILEAQLKALPEDAQDIVVLTHVPPFAQAAWHEGRMSDDYALPYFACAQTGFALGGYAFNNPDKKIRVYCGHTHGSGVYNHADNLVVYTGGSEYNKPSVCGRIEFAGDED